MARRYNYQKQEVISAMRDKGGFAMLVELYKLLDFSAWTTQTPEASVRRIVQENPEFFKIQPGLWALTECRETVLKKFHLEGFDTDAANEDVQKRTQTFTHSYYQGLIVEIGKMKHFATCVPKTDQKKLFLDKRLKEIIDLDEIHEFTYPEYLKIARNIDVIWFNERRLPNAFYEVELTTNIEHSLVKFWEFQDYHANFYIVADESRRGQYNALLEKATFRPLQGRVKFFNYDNLVSQHASMSELAKIETI